MSNKGGGYQITITPHRKLMELHLKETWQKRELISLFVKRNFVSKYKQTILGPLWAIIQPLLTTVVFTFVFGSLARLSTSDVVSGAASENLVPGFLFYMAGNICWAYFSSCLNDTSNTFGANAGIFGKVYFPRLVAPISTVISNLISFVIQFVMFLVFWGIFHIPAIQGDVTYTYHITAYAALVPLLILQMAMLGMGIGMIISSLTTKYRDLAMLVGFGVSLWQYATPIAYGLSLLNKWQDISALFSVYMLNPMTPIVTTFRYAFFGEGYFSIIYYLISWAVTLALMLLGLIIFSRTEKTFMDTI